MEALHHLLPLSLGWKKEQTERINHLMVFHSYYQAS